VADLAAAALEALAAADSVWAAMDYLALVLSTEWIVLL
jgi:hypothetical protein